MTREEWKERIPLIQAFAEGKRVQLNWDGEREWKDAHNISFENPVNSYRIAPEQNLRPWTAEEVPKFSIYRAVGEVEYWSTILGASPKGVVTSVSLAEKREYSFEQMFKCFEHSTDGGKTWKPCGVVEGEK